MQKCNKCNIVKELECFHKDNSKPSGFRRICKECLKTPEAKAKTKHYRSLYRNKTRIRHTAYMKLRCQTDKLFKLSQNTSTLINNALKRKKFAKKGRTCEILGCSYEEFKTYLESKFESWMNWDNYGKYNSEFNFGWDIDHIIPISSGKNEDEILKLNHYSNLQPLCSKTNREIKINKIYPSIG